MNYTIDETLNTFEVLYVTNDLQKQGVERATLQPGNECIWVNYGVIHAYYLFKKGKFLGVIYD